MSDEGSFMVPARSLFACYCDVQVPFAMCPATWPKLSLPVLMTSICFSQYDCQQ